RIEHTRLRVRNFDSEETHVGHALGGEIGDTGNRQGDDAQNHQEQSDYCDRSHLELPIMTLWRSYSLPECSRFEPVRWTWEIEKRLRSCLSTASDRSSCRIGERGRPKRRHPLAGRQ